MPAPCLAFGEGRWCRAFQQIGWHQPLAERSRQAFGTLTGRPDGDPLNFTFAFLSVGLISAMSMFEMRRLRPDAGAEMAGHAQAGREVAEPKPESRPQG